MTAKSKTLKTKKPAKGKIVYTLASVARSANLNPKIVRAKFRRLAEQAPFDHTKVKTLTPAQAKAAVEFVKTDFRVAN